ncbi:sulfite exporter TauE/SafE family protein [Solicola gregarius]|uniref:Probable membrane transporter protein n=1 Tax=Solicola gregarius TaxID=2908642 RepID=A0AA46TGS2_9ACTN|nr:sulfite exporter TauE/SafE family protein [Solicola gregarius]UYM04851.1 sulfite exporter TauE/SafE family protein [Solicola gregarius]
MIEGIDAGTFAVLAVAVLLGATVQGVVGLGVGLVLAPIAGLVDPSLLPGVPLWVALAMPMLTLSRDWPDVDWSGLRWAVPSRCVGTAAGVVVVAMASDRMIGIAVGAMVLVAITLSVRTIELRVSRRSLVAAGVVSGATGTATSIGGPPLALVYQHRDPPVVRGTLGVYMWLGTVFSLVGLAVSGALVERDTYLALALVPFVVVGFVAALLVRRYVPTRQVRFAMLAVCASSAAILLVRSLAG